MSCVTIKFSFLLPSWLRGKKRETKVEDESGNYVDLYWSFQPDYENQYDDVPLEEERESFGNIYDDVPLESQSLPSTLERTAMFEDIHSFLRSEQQTGHQSGHQEDSEMSRMMVEEDSELSFSSTQLSATKKRRSETEQLFQNYIFQDSNFDRGGLSAQRLRRPSSLV